MKISIITPTNNVQFLKELEETIMGQSYGNWEWVILLNQGASYSATDERIKIVECPFVSDSVGFLKRLACMNATGDVIAEVDHDDLLTKGCLAKVAAAFESDEEVGFVFSQNAKLADNFRPYMPEYGWTHSMFRWNKRNLYAMHNQPVTPGRLGHIWFAPDHIRCWRRDVYESIGGHDDSLKVCDDLDLMHRLYLATKFKEIPEVLYIYRITGNNTYVQRGKAIRELNDVIYNKNIVALSRRYAEINGLDVIYLNRGQDISALEDNSAGLIVANDVLQYVQDKVQFMQIAHRVLAPGGMLLCETPSTDGRGAFQDPEAVSFWNKNAFWYFTKREFAAKIRSKVLFRESKNATEYKDDFGKDHKVPYVIAHLEKV